MIKIKLIRKISGKKLIQEFEEKYGSIDNLKKIFKEGKGDMKMELDLEDWEYFQKHPEEEMEQRVLLYNDPSFSMTDLKILDFIKNEKPESISELAKLMNKDVGNIAKKINNLKEKGFIELEEKKLNNTKTPTFNYDKIEIEI